VSIAQLQLYLLLDGLGARPDPHKRLTIFLTNSLSGWRDSGDIKLTFPEMREEFDASQEVKRQAKIIVIIGNPPYDVSPVQRKRRKPSSSRITRESNSSRTSIRRRSR
jgi:predicted helicase